MFPKIFKEFLEFLSNFLIRGVSNIAKMWLSILLMGLLLVVRVVNERIKDLIAYIYLNNDESWPETITSFSGTLGYRLLCAGIPICVMVYFIDWVKKKHYEYDYQLIKHLELYKEMTSCVNDLRDYGINMETYHHGGDLETYHYGAELAHHATSSSCYGAN